MYEITYKIESTGIDGEKVIQQFSHTVETYAECMRYIEDTQETVKNAYEFYIKSIELVEG